MPKDDDIIAELKRRAEQVRYGSMTIEIRVQDGRIVSGEIIEQRIKLG